MMSRAIKHFFGHLGVFALNLVLLVHAQESPSGLISIDCGRTENSIYNEKTTGLDYMPDTSFIDTGESKVLPPDVREKSQQPYWTLRSFPQGIRNCYKINVTSENRYLIRASFTYNNYDGKNELPIFQLHLGPNLWDTVMFQSESDFVSKELIHVPLRNYVHICLVNNGSGVPFIKVIELRPLNIASYSPQDGSLALFTRFDIGQNSESNDGNYHRYPEDVHDRFWDVYDDSSDDWSHLSTSGTIDINNDYQPASVVMATAATPRSANGSLNIQWDPDDQGDAKDTEYYVYMHFAEVEKLQGNDSRWQYITKNGELYKDSFSPSYLSITTIQNNIALRGSQNISIVKSENSTHLPIINAIEIYKVVLFPELETNQEDVEAITFIKSTYDQITKNWQGDPCAPKTYSWEGLKCSYPENDFPRIISLNLSSSGLIGEVPHSISNLTMLQTLDLSNNNLTGPIPDFLSQLLHLNVLNLENNKFKGSLPVGLIERRDNGFLLISLCDNPNLTGNESCTKKKKKNNKILIPVVGSILGISVLLLTVAAIWCACKRKRRHAISVVNAKANRESVELEPKNRQFTYSEILKITNNGERVLGKGGFGTVYYGKLDDKTQVAVKLLSPSSSHGLEQFHAEVNLLLRVHHTNLISLVGYCNDEIHKALVYEYMENGNLQSYLSDKSPDVLTWEGRLRIAIEAAQGLEYLHYGCKPPMIHRDVKSTNILLNEKFQAKISDFGLSRNFPAGDGTHTLTGVAGTPGYLSPEYHLSNKLNEKTDVYGFGIVLLEIITGRPVFSTNGARTHISKWIEDILPKGDIYSIVDPMLGGNFDDNSAWKAVEIALACVSTDASKRPIMSKIEVDLKLCLATQLSKAKLSGYETGNSIDVVSQNNSITMTRPSVR